MTLKVISLGFLVVLAGCGKDDDKREASVDDFNIAENSITKDSALMAEAGAVGVSDGLDALSDTDAGSEALASLTLIGVERTFESKSTFSKSCAAADDKAAVTVSATIDREVVIKAARRTIERSVDGSSKVVRTFAMKDGSVDCDGKAADIDWLNDLTGLSVSVDITRSRERDAKVTVIKSGATSEVESSFTSEGTRTAEWTAFSEDNTTQTIKHSKKVTIDLNRTHKRKNSNGAERSMSFAIATSKDKPLMIDVVRNATSGGLISKTLKSGLITATRSKDGVVSTEFDSLTAVFSGKSCYFASGKATIKIYKDGSSDASKTLLVTADDGEYTVVDNDSNEAVDGFEFEDCSVEEFSEAKVQ